MADFSWAPPDLTGRFSYVSGKLYSSCEVCGVLKQTSGKGSVLKIIERDGTNKFRFCAVHGTYDGGKFSREEIDSWPHEHKRCAKCKIVKPFRDFHRHDQCLFGINTVCMECRRPLSKKRYLESTYEYKLFHSAKSRAKEKNREFSLKLEDIVIPGVCPVFGVPFVFEPNHPCAPSLDRLDSRLGYTKKNVAVITRRANMLKNDMSSEEAKMIVRFLVSNDL